MASSGRPDIGISTILYAPIRQIRQNYPLPGLFPKSPSTVPFLSNFFQKFLSLYYCYRKNTLKRSHPFETFFKKSVTLYRGYIQNDTPLCCYFRKKFRKTSSPTTDYRKNTPKRSHPFETFFQKKRYTLPGLFPKQHPVVLLLSEKIPKNIISAPLIISFSPQKRCTVFKKN